MSDSVPAPAPQAITAVGCFGRCTCNALYCAVREQNRRDDEAEAQERAAWLEAGLETLRGLDDD